MHVHNTYSCFSFLRSHGSPSLRTSRPGLGPQVSVAALLNKLGSCQHREGKEQALILEHGLTSRLSQLMRVGWVAG